MERKDFIKKGILGTGVFAATMAGWRSLANKIDEITPLEPMNTNDIVGFNHIQNTQSNIMENSVFHASNSRGLANHGWLVSRHTFSFANYYNPERMHFGVLRVLNDDVVAAGRGFGQHPHDNMEIISIPLKGNLAHQDSMGNKAIIAEGDIQVMSAGTGIQHSEMNASADEEVKFLQIWLFPNKKNVTPRYDQISLNIEDRKNKFQQVLSPNPNDAGVWIHQNAWFHLSDFDNGHSDVYTLKDKNNGLYIFNLSGSIKVGDTVLNDRDGFGLWSINNVNIQALSNASFLLMEVPMTV